MVVRADGVNAITIVRSAPAGEQDAGGSGGAGESRRLADRLRQSIDRHQVSWAKSRSGAAARGTRRAIGDSRGAAIELCQLSYGSSALSRCATRQICAAFGSAVFHRYRRAVGTPESRCSARRRQDHSLGARPDVYGDSRLGLSRRSAGRSEEHSLNSSHPSISYAVFCLKKKKKKKTLKNK